MNLQKFLSDEIHVVRVPIVFSHPHTSRRSLRAPSVQTPPKLECQPSSPRADAGGCCSARGRPPGHCRSLARTACLPSPKAESCVIRMCCEVLLSHHIIEYYLLKNLRPATHTHTYMYTAGAILMIHSAWSSKNDAGADDGTSDDNDEDDDVDADNGDDGDSQVWD